MALLAPVCTVPFSRRPLRPIMYSRIVGTSELPGSAVPLTVTRISTVRPLGIRVAVRVAVPSLIPVTTPFSSTEATAGSDTEYFVFPLISINPVESKRSAAVFFSPLMSASSAPPLSSRFSGASRVMKL